MNKSESNAQRDTSMFSSGCAASSILLVSFLAFFMLSVSQVYATQLPPAMYVPNALNGSLSIINRSIVVVNNTANAVLATMPIYIANDSEGDWSPLSIAVDNESIWVGRGVENAGHVNASPNSTTKLSLFGQVIQTKYLGFNPDNIAIDSQFVWIAGHDPSNYTSYVTKINKNTYVATNYTAANGLPDGAYGIAVDNETVWVACDQGNAIAKINKSSGAITTVSGPSVSIANPVGIAVDNDSVYYTDRSDMHVQKFWKANESSRWIANASNATAGGQVYGITVDSQYVWIGMLGDGSVKKLNKNTGAVLSTIVLNFTSQYAYIYGVSVDDDFAWVGIADLNKLAKINKTSNLVSLIPLGGDPIGFGDMTGYVFATMFSQQGGGGGSYNITGYVKDVAGNPIASANVTFMVGNQTSTLTNGGGYYSLTNVSGSGGLQAMKTGSFAPWVYSITLTSNLQQNFTLNSIGGGNEASNISWDNFQVFNNPQPPYAMNGPGCFGPGYSQSYSNGSVSPGQGCPGGDASYDLGAVWVDMDSQYISWQITGPAINMYGVPVNASNPTFCNASSTKTQYLQIEFDKDSNASTGCPSNRPCRMGSEYQIVVNQSGYYFRFYNSSLAATTCAAANGTECFTTNSSVNVSYTNPRCDPMNGMRILVPRSAITGLVGLAFEVNVISTSGQMGPVESLGGAGMAKSMMSGPMDMMFQGGQGCGQYQGNQTGCNASTSPKCKYNSQFGFCEPDMGQMDCSQFCGRCSTASACQSGAKGKCQIVTAPPQLSPDMAGMNFSNAGQNSICVENMAQMSMQMGGFGNCDSDCKFCPTEMMCNSSSVSSSSGSGKGCQWVTDAFFNKSWCDLSTVNTTTKFTCSNSSLDRCFDSTNCTTEGGTWNNSIKLCYLSGTEICFDGIDNDGNGQVDCADANCSKSIVCGGDINILTDSKLIQQGGANLNPLQAMQFKMFENIDPSPPAIIGGKPLSAGVRSDLQINGFGIKDMGNSLGLGIMVTNMQTTLLCNNTSGIATGVYYYMIDIDNNNNTGCTINISGTNRSGFEYMFEYRIQNQSNGSLLEVRKAYRCMPGDGFGLYAAKMAGSPNDPMGGNVACMQNAAVIAVDKTDIGSPTGPMRFAVATSDSNTALGAANDTLRCPGNQTSSQCDGLFYAPGTFDFKPNDCFANPMSCGSAFSMIGGGKFMPFEDCMSPQDDDANGLINCADPACIMAPFCAGAAGAYNVSADKTAPTVYSTSADTFTDFVMLQWTTNEPSNGTIMLYGSNTNTMCNANLLNTIYDIPPGTVTDFDKYRPFHGMPIKTGMLDYNGTSVTIMQNTTYFYRLQACDKAGNCAMSGCLNFTTKATGANTTFQFKFDFSPPPGAGALLNNTSMKLVLSNGTEINVANNMTNQSNYIQNASIKFNNPDPNANWTIELPGVDLAKALTMNLSAALNATNQSGKIYVGMDNNKWLEMAQNLGADKIKITIPEGGDKLIKCQTDNMSNCQDVTGNATYISNESGSGYSTWEIPSALGFSVYGVNSSGSTLASDKDVYKCYPNCTMYFNLTTYNASLIGIRNITINYSDDSGNKMSYNTSVWNGTAYNIANVDANTTANLTNYNLTASDPSLRIVITMSSPRAAHLNVTLNIQNATGSQANVTDSAFIDSINLTSPANGTTKGANATYNFTLYSMNTSNQTCALYINGTNSGATNASNGTAASIQSNWAISGNYSWYVNCTTAGGESGVSGSIYVLVDAVAPVVTLVSPANNTFFSQSNISLSFNVTDNSPAVNCMLWWNSSGGGGIGNQTLSGVPTNSSSESAGWLNDSDGITYWYINCTDAAGNTGTSATNVFTRDTNAPLLNAVSPANNGFVNNLTFAVVYNLTEANVDYALVSVYNSTGGLVSGTVCSPGPTSGLISYWTFNDGSGTNARDSSGGKNGTIYGASWTAGIVGDALGFDGSNDALNVSNNASFNFGNGSFTIEWWENRASTIGNMAAIARSATIAVGPPLPFVLGYASSNVAYVYMSSDLATWDFTTNGGKTFGPISTNVWVHFAVVRDGDTFHLYKNGLQTDTWDSPSPGLALASSAEALAIGGPYNGQYFIGMIDEVAIFNRSLSQSEVNQTYQYGLSHKSICGGSYANGTVSTNVTVPYDGKYNITISTADMVGKTNSTSIENITVDATAPALAATAPSASAYYSTSVLTINYTLTEANLNQTNITVRYSSNGTIANSTLNSSTGSVSVPLTVPDGRYNISITTTDLSGSTATATINNVTVDTAAPLLNAVTPANNGFVNNLTFAVTYNLTETNVNFTNVSVYNISGGLVNWSTGTGNGSAAAINVTVLADGMYNITISTIDKAGFTNSTTIQNITVDTVVPVVNATSPSPNIYTSSSLLTINFTVTEANINTTTISLINSTGGTANSTTNSSTGPVSVNLTAYVDGVYNITISTSDTSGSVTTATINNVTVDTTNPLLSAISPSANVFVNSTTLNITYNLTETNVNTTYINVSYSNGTLVNSTSSSSSGIVSVSLTVPGDGNYNISLTTYDKVSRSNSTTINNVTVDTISPVLNATYPVSNSYLNSSVLTINFTVTETNLNNTNVSVLNSTGGLVNTTFNTSTGAISVNLTVLADGVYNITLLTRDLGARTASATISNLTVDTTNPLLSATSPSANTFVNSTTLNITYNLTETNVNTTYINVSYSNGTLVNSTSSSSSGIVSVSLTVPGDGNYNISLTTYDKVSRSNSTTINNVTVDTISPVLNATYPVSNSYLNSSVLTINFTVTETNLNNTNVSVLNSTGGIVNSTLNTSTGAISVNLTVLADGVYNVTLLTRDLGARTASATISNLTVDTTSPVITGVALNRSIMQNNTPVLVSVNYTESNFKNATAQGTLMTCSNGSCSVTINLTSGTSPLNVTVCDYANHCTTNNAVTFIIDNTVPAVNTATLSDYYVSTGQSVVVTVNATDANGVASVTANGVALTQQGGGAIWNGTINLTGSTGPANATVVATDNASNTNTTYIAYTMDNVAPVITVNSPTNGSTVSDVSGNLTLNYTVVEAQIISSNVSIDGGVFTNSTTSNGTTLFNFTGIAAGTHTIVINAYDNASLSSTSTTTFVMSRPVNATAALATMQTSVGNATLTNITLSDVATNTNQSGNQTLNVSQPLKLEMGINASTTGANVTVTIPAFTGTDANWNATTFNITTNLTGNVALNTSAHTGSSIIALVSFVNMSNFLSNTAYTNGTTVVFQYALTSGIDVLYLADDVGNVVYKLGTCPGSVPPATVSSATMCYLNTSTTVTAYIPHLSGAALSNDTLAPTVNITSPATNLSTVANSYLTFSFDAWEANPNATRFCWYNLTNASNAQIRTANLTTASFTQVGTKYNFSTLFSALPNLAYNITVNCTDQNGNSSQVRYVFTIADTTAPAVTAISATTSGSTVTLSVTTDEAAECRFATTDIAWSSMLNMTTTNSTTHSNAIAYNADASGTYYVRCNDTAGNAMTSSNSTLFSVTVGGGSSCSPSWSCTEWTTCSASSNQVRTCTDANSCGTTVSKPSESQYCIYNAPATCTGTCGLGYYQQPYPGCACVLLACSNTCPTGQTRNVYPDCTCVSPPTNVTPPGDVTVVATRGGAIIRIPSIAAERRSSVSISAVITGATGILDISIVPRRDLAGLKIEFAKLDAKPSSVPNPPNTAYRYYEIKAENVTESDLENATITFQISKTFIGTKYNASSVAMMRHTSAGWATLDTRLISQTTSDYIFEATTPGFSYFAITVAEMGAPPIVITPQGNVTNETGTTVPPIEIGTIAIWVIGIVVAAGIIAFAYQKVNSQKKWKPKSK